MKETNKTITKVILKRFEGNGISEYVLLKHTDLKHSELIEVLKDLYKEGIIEPTEKMWKLR